MTGHRKTAGRSRISHDRRSAAEPAFCGGTLGHSRVSSAPLRSHELRRPSLAEFSRGRGERSDVPDVGWNDLLGRTRETLNACIHLVQKFPGLRAIEPPDSSRLDDGGIEVAKINSHPVRGPIGWFPVRNAPAVGAPNKPEALVSPDVP